MVVGPREAAAALALIRVGVRDIRVRVRFRVRVRVRANVRLRVRVRVRAAALTVELERDVERRARRLVEDGLTWMHRMAGWMHRIAGWLRRGTGWIHRAVDVCSIVERCFAVQVDEVLSKARLNRVSSRPVCGLLVWALLV